MRVTFIIDRPQQNDDNSSYPMPHAALAEFLKTTQPFARLNPRALEELARAATITDDPAGAMLDSGDWHESVWLVQAGLVRIISHPCGNDEPMTLFVAGRGDLIGCLDTQCARKHEYSCAAAVDSRVARLPRGHIQKLLAIDLPFQAGVLHMLNERLWECRAHCMSQTQTAEQRLANTLLMLDDKLGPSLPFTRRALAELSGLARETAIRALGPLEKSGAVKSARGSIQIMRRDKLQKISLG